MELRRKLEVLADAAKYDASCASSGSKRAAPKGGVGNVTGTGICHSYTPDGRCVSLLKILLTNHCVYDCLYCINRVSSDVERARFTPEEVVRLTLDFYKRNYIEGLFLSSGVLKNPDATMEEMTRVAMSLRREHGFGGYIHLKAVAGASNEAVTRAGLWADRISVNIELPTERDLSALAPEKSRPAIESAMGSIRDEIEIAKDGGPRFAPAGQSTQMIVGATESTDRDILQTASSLYRVHRLRRVYYTAFSPIPRPDARLTPKAPPLVREHRLYEADWLVRFYGFSVAELTADVANLDLEIDPKLAWALANRAFFPIDVNTAPRELLLRVPGLGVRNVKKILAMRPHRAVRVDDLRRLKVPLRRTLPFVTTADSTRSDRGPGAGLDGADLRARLRPAEQLGLFEARAAAGSGEL